MNRKGRMIGIVVGLILTMNCGLAEAGERKAQGWFSGGFVAGPDTNYDGILSADHTQLVVSTIGIFINEVLSEVGLPGQGLPLPAGSCPPNTLEFPILYDEVVSTHLWSGDLLYSSFTSGRFCLNPTTGRFTFKGDAVYTGGTGQFTGASGPFTVKSSGRLLPDGSGNQSGTFKGTLILP